MPAYFTELSVDPYFWRGNSNSWNCLNWTFNYDFWIGVTVHPEGNPNISKQIDVNKHKPLLESPSEALNDCKDFSWTRLELPSTSYSWRSSRLPIPRWYNPHNGQYSSCLSWPGYRQVLRHRSWSRRWLFYTNDRKKKILLLQMHPQTPVNWQTTLSGRKRCSLLYSEDQPLSGMRITSTMLLPWKMSEQISSLDFQTDETNFDTEWKWDIVSEEMEKKFETFYTVSKEKLTKALARWYEWYWSRATKCRTRRSSTTKKIKIHRLLTKRTTT